MPAQPPADRLARYWSKRDFGVTGEPRGDVGASGSELAFVVQKHHASRLHYDFRLELDGVMLEVGRFHQEFERHLEYLGDFEIVEFEIQRRCDEPYHGRDGEARRRAVFGQAAENLDLARIEQERAAVRAELEAVRSSVALALAAAAPAR